MNISSKKSILACLSASLAPLASLSCTPAAMPSSITTAFLNEKSSLSMELIARYDAEQLGIDAAVMEIISYNEVNGHAYAVNGKTGQLAILNIGNIKASDTKVTSLVAREFNVKSAVKQRDSNFDYKDMTSVAVSPTGTQLAIALQAEGYHDKGRVAILNCAADGSLSLAELITVGVQPDMLCYADNNTILTANEGEPRKGYGAESIDPKGGVSIINIAQRSSRDLGFEAFDSPAARAQLVAKGVILKKGALPSDDLEPEYISVSKGKAYIALQEANAIAVLDLHSQKIENIFALGTTDYGKTVIDLNSKDRKASRSLQAGYHGLRMPDAIAAYQSAGRSFLITANEGDGREWGKKKTDSYYENEMKLKIAETKVTQLNPATVDGLDTQKNYLYGSRSFSIYAVGSGGMNLVFDSGSQFEEIVGQTLGFFYSLSGDGLGLDDRSGKKGPEPECVTVGEINGTTYAFIGLERTGGIMAYDISQPSRAKFVNYLNTRDFNNIVTHKNEEGDDVAITGGDISPEGLAFVPAKGDQPAMLLVANEVSGTVMVLKLK